MNLLDCIEKYPAELMSYSFTSEARWVCKVFASKIDHEEYKLIPHQFFEIVGQGITACEAYEDWHTKIVECYIND